MSRNVSKLKSRFPTFPHLVSFFFSAYFIPKDWQPSLCLTLLTRNLITSHAVITPDSTAVKARGMFHGQYCDAYVSAALGYL